MKYFFKIFLSLLFAISAEANTIERIVEGAYSEIRNETEYNTEMLDKYFPLIFEGKTIEQDILEGPEFLWTPVGNWKIIGHYRIK